MECNKDEAIKAKDIADSKLTKMDIVGANKFALKAQNLYPELEGLSDLLAALHVYSFAEAKVNGEVDWYGVIGVEPSANDDTIRRNYKHMALALHPDKNKSIGADGAFKILSQAWTVLSDKNKKIAYDQKRNLNAMYSNAAAGKPPVATRHNGFTSSNYSNVRDSKTVIPPSPQRMPKANTFWTVCPSCKMQFEYAIIFLRVKLVCPNCHRQFLAIETQPPNSPHAPWAGQQKNSHIRGKNLASAGFSGSDSLKNSTLQSGMYSKSDGVGSVRAPTFSATRATGVVHPSREQQKRRREEAMKTGIGLGVGSSKSSVKGDRPRKKRGIDPHSLNGDAITTMKKTSNGNGGFEVRNIAGKSRLNYARELSQLENVNLLMQMAKKEIGKRINQWHVAAASATDNKPKASDVQVKEKENMKEGSEKPKPDEKMERSEKPKPDEKMERNEKPKLDLKEKSRDVEKVVVDCLIVDAMSVESVDNKKKVQCEQVYPENSNVDSDMDNVNLMSMSVPDPDFHDFDKDRTEKSFGDSQVWAAYDDDDGMPRYYAMIHSVISLKPFKMKMSWLNTKSNTELGPLNWVGSGFYKTCGEFRIGKHLVDNSLNSFSHTVKWSKGTKGAIHIYPMQGDVWALYSNWSSDWNELTQDEVIHKYDMVEVLDAYDGNGVTVAPLVKVAGYKTVFCRHSDTKEFIKIPREEMFRLSHQVPSYKLTGQEGQNAPKDCLELDPAAMPPELLQVTEGNIKDARAKVPDSSVQESKEQIVKCAEKETVPDKKGKEVKREGLMVYSRRNGH